ncbi:hypothetical protein ACQP1P_01780 [Dactylosporangium sp. CA-052675]|uniref:hypothetical protein n=1 Tax=Dactylosporangium sp. CA-052675 TaxID=3239927 RepID=UPI003D948806
MPGSEEPADGRQWTLYNSGRRSLRERLYREAEETLSQFLSREPRTDKSAPRRARAHALIALAILARTPPLSRSTREVGHVVSRLQNARKLPLAQVMASLVIETFYETDAWNVPEGFRSLAEDADVEALPGPDIELLIRHLPGMFGKTWERIRRQAGLLGLGERPPPFVETELVDERRKKLVRRYFAEIPRKPEDPQWTLVAWLLSIGVLAGVLPCGGLYVTTRWYVGLPIVLGLYLLAAVLLFFGIVTARESRESQKKIRVRAAAIAATQPQASETELDAWLEMEVSRVTRLGAERHRLDSGVGLKDAGLLMAPQVIVGVSKLAGPYSVERREPDANSASGLRTVMRKLPLAKTRIGDDGKVRASHYQILVMYLTERRVGVFECDVDMATRELLAESTHSFSYDDVVTMSSQKIAAGGGQGNLHVLIDRHHNSATISGEHRFVMSLVNGHRIEVSTAVHNATASDSSSVIAWPNDQVQRSIERMVWALKDSRVA